MLLKILQRLDRTRFEPVVVSLLDEGTVGAQIIDLGIPVVSLRMDTLHRIIAAPFRLARLIRNHRFALIQGWMYHGNLLAWLGRALAFCKVPLSFGVRQSLYGLSGERFNTRWVIRANSWLSGWIQGCVFNSQVSLRTHADFGFSCANMEVIPNGFDIQVFSPRPEDGRALRADLGLGASLVVGMIARFHPIKGHRNFLEAAAIVRSRIPTAKFVLVGTGVTIRNSQLLEWIEDLGLDGAVILLGERADVAEVNSAFDIACLSSLAEAFPNVVGESMACGIPCIVTDVGDCAEIVGATGRVALRGNSESLAIAMLELLVATPCERKDLGRAARLRIIEHFDIERVVIRYEQYFDALSNQTVRNREVSR